MPIIKTDEGRKKRLQAYIGTISCLPKISQVAIGDGGREPSGSLKYPNSSMTSLYNEIKRLNVEFENINEFIVKFVCFLDSKTMPELVGKDINEMALIDSEGTLITIETFNLFGDVGFPSNTRVSLKTQLVVE